MVTYARDRAVRAWCRAQAFPGEHQTFGVTRGLRNRTALAVVGRGICPAWLALRRPESRPPRPHPASVFAKLPVDSFHPAVPRRAPSLTAGEDAAQARLTSFEDAGQTIPPLSAPPWRCIAAASFPSSDLGPPVPASRRATHVRAAKQTPTLAPSLGPGVLLKPASLALPLHSEAGGGTRARDHQLQSRLDTLRPRGPSEALEAWLRGQTGPSWMRPCAHFSTGVDHRMRAMLVSVAAYHLWLDWRDLISPGPTVY